MIKSMSFTRFYAHIHRYKERDRSGKVLGDWSWEIAKVAALAVEAEIPVYIPILHTYGLLNTLLDTTSSPRTSGVLQWLFPRNRADRAL